MYYIKIDTFYASSQIYSNCGYQNKDMKDLSVGNGCAQYVEQSMTKISMLRKIF